MNHGATGQCVLGIKNYPRVLTWRRYEKSFTLTLTININTYCTRPENYNKQTKTKKKTKKTVESHTVRLKIINRGTRYSGQKTRVTNSFQSVSGAAFS